MMRSKIVDFFKTTEVSETTIETIKEKLKETAELNTAEYVCTDMLTKSDVKEFHNWTIPFTENEFAISYDGTIKAGIKDLTQADVEQSGSKIIITLPEVEITGIELGNYKKYDEKNNIFNPIDTDEINDAQEDLKEKMIQNAKDKGILDMAKDNAEKTLTSLLGGLDDSYTIEVQWKD